MTKLFSIFLLVCLTVGLRLQAQNIWTANGDANRGTHLYTSQGALGYSVRTNTGGGWAWQFVDGGNIPYFNVQYPTGYVGIGTITPRGKLDVDGPGDIYLSDDPNTGIDQSVFLPGHIYIAPHDGSNLSYFQARRLNNSGTTSLRIRTFNSGNITEAMQIEGNGNVGIGDLNPFSKLAIKGDFNVALEPSSGGPVYFYITTNSANNIIGVNARTKTGLWDIPDTSKPSSFIDFSTYNVNNPYYGGIAFFTRGSGASGIGSEKMVLLNNGNVGIGTTTPGSFKLAVNGKIWGTEVQVALNNPGPDYVFNSDYNLLSLEEIKTYIDKNKHLPEVPSAKEMEANGVQLGEMNMLLLKKIEELTLYQIQSLERIQKLEKEIINLKKNAYE
jgi:hypothetical protein